MIQEERVKELLPQEQEKKLRQNNPDTPDYQIDLATNRALGMIETEGFVAAIVAADAGLKAASVNLYSLGKVGSGIVTIFLTGDVGAIQSAVDAGSEAAAAIGILRAKHIIPRIHTDVAIKTIHPIKPVWIPTGENGDTEVVTLAKSRADMPSAVVRADSIKNEKAGETMEKELNEIETLGNGDFYLEKFQDEPLDQNSYNKNNLCSMR